jgi:L-seryl-tRNA(Ser) seleniumtransferase
LPTVELPTVAVALGTPELPAEDLDAKLRTGDPPVVARVKYGRLLLDMRTVLPSQVGDLSRVLSGL